MENYGLIGENIKYSFSKIIHEQISDYKYDLISLSNENFDKFMKEHNFKAINVTIPYKQKVLPYIDKIDQHAKNIGSVNTIINKNNKLYGYNTDFYGFLYQIKKNNIEIKGKKILVLGNGGAAKSVIAVLKYLEANEIYIVYYKKNKNTISYKECYENHTDSDILINTTPVGMFSKNNTSPINIYKFKKLKVVIDLIYNPLKTKLLIQAENMKIKTINGIEMLVAQAKYSAEYFLNTKIEDKIIEKIVKNIKFEKSNIVLIGMPSAGKTTIGKLCSIELKKEFIDIDDMITKKINMPISKYFETYGEKKFRQLEKKICQDIAFKNNCIISTGGGVIKNYKNIENLKANGIIIFIDRNINNLSIDSSRPLSKNRNSLKLMYKQRLPLYKKYADIIVYNNNNFNKCKNNIIKEINRYFEI